MTLLRILFFFILSCLFFINLTIIRTINYFDNNINYVFFLKADTIIIVVNLIIFNLKNGIRNDSFIIKFYR